MPREHFAEIGDTVELVVHRASGDRSSPPIGDLRLAFGDLRIRGETASVVVAYDHGGGGGTWELELQRVGGGWRVTRDRLAEVWIARSPTARSSGLARNP